jgi:hypothetical protein
MLTLYRRHLKRCSKKDDRYWKRCSCPMWVEGTVNGTYIRHSLQTASWERAQGLALEIESADDPKALPAKKEEPITIQQAVDEYLEDAKARDLAESTLAKLDTIFRKQLLGWARSEGYTLLRELDLRAVQASHHMEGWRAGKEEKAGAHHGLFLVLHSCRMDCDQSYAQSQANYRPSEAHGLLLARRIHEDYRGHLPT